MPWLLPAIAVFQILGVVAADGGWVSAAAARAVGALAAVGGLFGLAHARRVALAALALAFAAGALAMATRLAAPRGGVAAGEVTVEGTVAEVTRRGGGFRIRLTDVAAVTPPAPGESSGVPSRILLYGYGAAVVDPALDARHPGERIRARVRLRAPRRLRNPGSLGGLRALRRAGIGAEGSLVHPALHVRLPAREGLHFRSRLHLRRAQFSDRMAAANDRSGLLQALALGDRSHVDPALREDFARMGLSHLLAVSGLHLALVAAAVFALARTGLRRSRTLAARWDTRVLALACAFAAACAYAALSGFGVPVRRALVLFAGLTLAFLRGRARAASPPLAAAAVFVAADDPASVFGAGAQLSFAASLALVIAIRRDDRDTSTDRVGVQTLRNALRTSASAVAVTAPLAAWHLGRSAPFALPLNLVAIPWTAGVLLPAALVALVAAALPAGSATDAVLAGCGTVANASAAAARALASRLPAAALTGGFAPSVWGILAVLALASLVVRRTRRRVAIALAVGAIVALAPPRTLAPPAPRLIALEVGQGDATLVEGRAGAVVLIDAGTAHPMGGDRGASVVLPALAALGIHTLALVVVTHADLDHRGGVPAVLRGIPVGQVWLPYGAAAEPAFDAIRAAAREHGVPIRERGAAAAPFEAGGLRVVPLWPPRHRAGSRNDRSLVVRIDVAGRRVLLPGDIEAPAETALVAGGSDLRADVLLLAHHGSRTSSSGAFLDAVDPDIAIVQAPCAGRFGMPHASVVRRVFERRATLWWTGRDGAVRIGLGAPLTTTGTGDAGGPQWAECGRRLPVGSGPL